MPEVVNASSDSAELPAVHATNNAKGGTGVYAVCSTGHGVRGESDTSKGVVGMSKGFQGVYGHSDTNAGVVGESSAWVGVVGRSLHESAGIGVMGEASKGPGVSGNGTGVLGASTGGHGVEGTSVGSKGVVGTSRDFQGVYGHSDKNAGVVGESATWVGVYGRSVAADGGIGVMGDALAGNGASGAGTGLRGASTAGIGVHATSEGGAALHASSTTGEALHAETGSSEVAAVAAYNTNAVSNSAAVFAKKEGAAGHAGYFDGNVHITKDCTVDGDVKFTGGGDVAEQFDIVGDADAQPGSVMVLAGDDQVQVSDRPYDRRVAGIVSGAGTYRPALVLDHQSGPDRRPLALTGKVWCMVEADSEPIELGDLLTTSAIPGHAMRASDQRRAFGAVVGKALAGLTSGHGLIPVLVALQ